MTTKICDVLIPYPSFAVIFISYEVPDADKGGVQFKIPVLVENAKFDPSWFKSVEQFGALTATEPSTKVSY